MPAINFKTKWPNGSPTNFREMILEGRKPHTIRPVRQHPIKPGQMLYLNTGMRTSHCERIMAIPCLKVRPISIYFDENYMHPPMVCLNGMPLSNEQIVKLVANDGMESKEQFFEFFHYLYDQWQVEFNLRLIQWAETEY